VTQCRLGEVADQCLDWGDFDGGIDPGVVHEGGDWEPVAPVVLLGGCDELKVLFYPLILPL
jgi:hypothetical protein